MSVGTELNLIPEIENPAELFKPGGLDSILAIHRSKGPRDGARLFDRSRTQGHRVSSPARSHRRKRYIDDAGKYAGF